MLSEANVVITPGAGFGRQGEGFFRISAFNSRANVEEVVKRMKSLNSREAAPRGVTGEKRVREPLARG